MTASRQRGVTLVEILIALAVFSVVMAIAYGAINGSLRVQADQEAATTTQGKLRRIVEVITQDLRGAVFGSITTQPYASDNSQVSFLMLTGGAGYTVLQPALANSFPDETEARILMNEADRLRGKQVAMINSTRREGVVLPVESVRPGLTSGEWILQWGGGCSNTVQYDLNSTLIFEVETTGLRYDPDSRTIRTTSAAGAEAPFAFDIADFRIEYIYTDGTDVRTQVTPHTVAGVPQRVYDDGSGEWYLQRLQFVVGADAESRGQTIQHAHTGQVDLSSNEDFRVEEIRPCK